MKVAVCRHETLPPFKTKKTTNKQHETSKIAQLNDHGTVNIWEIETDVTKRPIRIIIDTGSEATLIANDVIKNDMNIEASKILLTGIAGNEHPITTDGLVHGQYILGDSKWQDVFHLISRQFTGPYDGFLGLEFLKTYKAIIDLHENSLRLTKGGQPNEMKENSQVYAELYSKKSNTVNTSEALCANAKMVGCLGRQCFTCNTNFERLKSENIFLDKMKNLDVDAMSSNQQQHLDSNTGIFKHPSTTVYDEQSENERLLDFEVESNNNHLSDTNEIEKIRSLMRTTNIKNIEAKIYATVFDVEQKPQVPKPKHCFSNRNTDREKFIFENMPLEECSEINKRKIKNLINEYPNQFYVEGDTLSMINTIQHRIILKSGTPPINVKQYRVPQAHKQKLYEKINDLERQGIIEPSTSPFNAPALLVKKQD